MNLSKYRRLKGKVFDSGYNIKRVYFRWKNSIFDKAYSYGFAGSWGKVRKNRNKKQNIGYG